MKIILVGGYNYFVLYRAASHTPVIIFLQGQFCFHSSYTTTIGRGLKGYNFRVVTVIRLVTSHVSRLVMFSFQSNFVQW